MLIRFQNVFPIPLADTPLAEASIWKKEVRFDTRSNYLVEAPSGTGKTTLVSLLYGTRSDYEGELFFDDEPIRNFSAAKWSELRQDTFSIVFQELRLFPQLTALENIRLKNQLKETLSEAEIKQLAEEIGIDHRLDQPCGKMSLGQQQRVAIIRALAQPFRFLLLDEPFSHLDKENTAKACSMIKRACETNQAGLLLTSLAPDENFQFTGKIVI
jgi:putative ABC transport system ATP-binding protein